MSFVMFQHSCPLVQSLVMILQNGENPLGTASCGGHLDIVKSLIEEGANVNQGDEVGTHTSSVLLHNFHMHVYI